MDKLLNDKYKIIQNNKNSDNQKDIIINSNKIISHIKYKYSKWCIVYIIYYIIKLSIKNKNK